MKALRMTMASVATALVVTTAGGGFAQARVVHHHFHPLTVHRAVEAPVVAAGAVIAGAASVAAAPFFFFGSYPKPPLPIKAMYAGAGPQVATVDEGWTPDVPLDHSGPIYMLDPDAPKLKIGPF